MLPRSVARSSVLLACLSCSLVAEEDEPGRSASVFSSLEPVAAHGEAITEEVLRGAAISGVYGYAWSTGMCSFSARSLPDGSYGVRTETGDFDGRRHTYKIGTCTILPGQADRIRRQLARTPLRSLAPFAQGSAIDAGMTVVFIDLPDGTVLCFGGEGGADSDTTTPVGACIAMLREAFISWPLHGEDADAASQRNEALENLRNFVPTETGPYVCAYDVSPICPTDTHAAELEEQIRERVDSGTWMPELGNQVNARERRLIVMASRALHALVHEYLRRQGMSDAALTPLPPERLYLPCPFTDREVATVQTAEDKSIPERLDLLRPVWVDPPVLRGLGGAALWIAIQHSRGLLDEAALSALRDRQSPLHMCAALVALMERAERDGDTRNLAVLSGIQARWERACPWSRDFAACFRHLINQDSGAE